MNNAYVIAQIKEACETLGLDVRSYSGRGMMGKECLGVVVPRGQGLVNFGVSLAVELASLGHRNAIDAVVEGTWCTDSMGYDTIVYCPSIVWEEVEEEEEEFAGEDTAAVLQFIAHERLPQD